MSNSLDYSTVNISGPTGLFAADPGVPGLMMEQPRRASFGNTLETILVVVDGSQHAEYALPHALAIARRGGATVRVVQTHALRGYIEPHDAFASFEKYEFFRREKQEYLKALTSRVSRMAKVSIDTSLIHCTEPCQALVDEAADADLVVVAARRRGMLRSLWSDSLVPSLRRQASAPLLLVPGYSAPVDLTAAPVARHVLVSLDGTQASERALASAVRLGRHEEATISMLNVQNGMCFRGNVNSETSADDLQALARATNDSVPLAQPYSIFTARRVARRIAAYAERNQVDLIAISTYDNGHFRPLRASLGNWLLRYTSLPILEQRVGIRVAEMD